MRFFRNLFNFAKKVVKSAFQAVGKFVKEVTSNAFGVVGCAAMAVGFTSLATQVPFLVQAPLWVEMTMVAPMIGLAATCLVILGMRWQLQLQGVSEHALQPI